MSWWTVDEAAERGLSREAWLEQVAAGDVESYVDGWGRRWLWIEPGAEPQPAPALALTLLDRPASPEPVRARRPAPPARALEPDEVLALCAARWGGSDRELERQAGLPKAFLAKAKRGLRGGPRSRSSWDRLHRFLLAA